MTTPSLIRRTSTAFALSGMLVALAACGGGDGDTDSSSDGGSNGGGSGGGTFSMGSFKGRQFQEAKRDVLARFERDYFAALAEESKGNVSEMARRAGMERAHVRAYLRRHGILAKGESADQE